MHWIVGMDPKASVILFWRDDAKSCTKDKEPLYENLAMKNDEVLNFYHIDCKIVENNKKFYMQNFTISNV